MWNKKINIQFMKTVWLLITNNYGKMCLIGVFFISLMLNIFNDGYFEYEVTRYQRMGDDTLYVVLHTGSEILLHGRSQLIGNIMFNEDQSVNIFTILIMLISAFVFFSLALSNDSDQNFGWSRIAAYRISENINVIHVDYTYHYLMDGRLLHTNDYLMNCQGSTMINLLMEYKENKFNFPIFTTPALMRNTRINDILN